jgi:hypothetical protein
MADHRHKKRKKRKKKTIKSYGSAATLMAADCPGRCKIANNMPQLEAIIFHPSQVKFYIDVL